MFTVHSDSPQPPDTPTTKKQPPKWVWVVVAAVAILVCALIVATVWLLASRPADAPEPSTTPPTLEQPEVTEEPEPETPAAIVIPGCEALSPTAFGFAEEAVAQYADIGMRYGEIDLAALDYIFGPAAHAALDASSQAQNCTYPFHLEAGLTVFAAQLPADARDTFVAALEGDSDYVMSTSGPAELHVWHEPLEEAHWDAAYTVHGFIGDVWFATYGPAEPEQFTPEIIDAIVAANPQYG